LIKRQSHYFTEPQPQFNSSYKLPYSDFLLDHISATYKFYFSLD
jgi:hypothetical protein